MRRRGLARRGRSPLREAFIHLDSAAYETSAFLRSGPDRSTLCGSRALPALAGRGHQAAPVRRLLTAFNRGRLSTATSAEVFRLLG